jgi:hypothetical protein
VIRETIESADIIIFLVSDSFLASDYCVETEATIAFERAKKNSADVIPIVVRAVDFKSSVFADYQGLPPGLRPIEEFRYRARAYKAISEAIRSLVSERRSSSRSANRFWNVPEKTRNLVGREAFLQQLAGTFASERPPIVTLIGGGGVGKSSIAVEYAWANRERYDFVAWLPAEEESALEWQFARLAERVGLPSTNMDTAKAAFRDWLGDIDRWERRSWLLVFDNATEENWIRRLLPERMSGHALITTRDLLWRNLGHKMNVEGLSAEDAIEYLLTATGSTDEAAARKLAAAVQQIPLALEQAVASIREEQLTMAEFVEQLQRR